METAKQNRKAARFWVTKCGNLLLNAIESDSDPLSVERDFADFKERVERLDSCQESCESLIDPDELEKDIDYALEFYNSRVRLVVNKVTAFLPSVKPPVVVDSDVDSHVSGHSAHSSFHAEARMPKIILPEFAGDMEEWQSWWDMFEANVHNSDRPPVTKFSYLKSLLKGDALAVVAGLKLTAVNYPVAISLITNRYGRPDRVIFQHIEALLNIRVVSDPSVVQLYHMFDSLQAHIRSLETMGISGSQYGVILTPLILSRLPSSLRLQWVRESEREERASRGSRATSSAPGDTSGASKPPVGADLAFLLEFLEREINRREMSQVYTGMRSGQLDAPSSSAAVLHSGAKAKPTGCGVCSQKHPTSQCPTLASASIDERRELLKEHGICMKCLRKSSKVIAMTSKLVQVSVRSAINPIISCSVPSLPLPLLTLLLKRPLPFLAPPLLFLLCLILVVLRSFFRP